MHWKSPIGRALCALTLAVMAGAPPRLRAQTTAPSWTAFAADVAIRQVYVAASGTPTKSQPPLLTLRLERRRAGARWRTTLALRSITMPTIRFSTGPRQIDNPYLVTRMEYDGDGTAPRFYDGRGEMVRLAGESDRRLMNVPAAPAWMTSNWTVVTGLGGTSVPAATTSEWIDNVVATPDRRAERRQAIEARFGPPQAQVAGLDRYNATRGTMAEELFVNTQEVVPLEMNAARSGVLVARTTYSHEPQAGGALLRRLTHVERAIPEIAGMRAMTDVEVFNVSMSTEATQ